MKGTSGWRRGTRKHSLLGADQVETNLVGIETGGHMTGLGTTGLRRGRRNNSF
jgi:hypothetical protein